MTNFSPVIDYEMRFVKMQFSKIDITMTTINRKLQIDKTWITTGNVCCGVFFVDWATLGRGKFDLGANAPCPGAVFHSVWRKKIFWTQWLEEMFISSNMRGDISLWNVYCGAAMIEVCLWSKKSATGSPAVFLCCLYFVLWREWRGSNNNSQENRLNRWIHTRKHRNTSEVISFVYFIEK